MTRSTKKATLEERRRKSALFAGRHETTKGSNIVIYLYALHSGRDAYRIKVRSTVGWLAVDSTVLRCRTLREADECVSNMIQNSYVLAALKALGIS